MLARLSAFFSSLTSFFLIISKASASVTSSVPASANKSSPNDAIDSKIDARFFFCFFSSTASAMRCASKYAASCSLRANDARRLFSTLSTAFSTSSESVRSTVSRFSLFSPAVGAGAGAGVRSTAAMGAGAGASSSSIVGWRRAPAPLSLGLLVGSPRWLSSCSTSAITPMARRVMLPIRSSSFAAVAGELMEVWRTAAVRLGRVRIQ